VYNQYQHGNPQKKKSGWPQLHFLAQREGPPHAFSFRKTITGVLPEIEGFGSCKRLMKLRRLWVEGLTSNDSCVDDRA
jgi:hypothetical protein